MCSNAKQHNRLVTALQISSVHTTSIVSYRKFVSSLISTIIESATCYNRKDMTKVFMILLLLMNCASTPSTTILDASGISDKVRIEVTGASVPKLSALGWTTATLY